MKNFVYVSMLSAAMLCSTLSYSMRVESRPISVDFSNHTNDSMTIVPSENDSEKDVIALPAFSDVSIRVEPRLYRQLKM